MVFKIWKEFEVYFEPMTCYHKNIPICKKRLNYSIETFFKRMKSFTFNFEGTWLIWTKQKLLLWFASPVQRKRPPKIFSVDFLSNATISNCSWLAIDEIYCDQLASIGQFRYLKTLTWLRGLGE